MARSPFSQERQKASRTTVPTKRQLLIVEDDRDTSNMYADVCRLALAELAAEGLAVEASIRQAFDFLQAEKILAGAPVDFVSLDLALAEDRQDFAGEGRTMQELDGFHLLERLGEIDCPPIAIVVTGESLPPAVRADLEQYGVLASYQKDEFDVLEYKNAVKAALWYLDTLRLLSERATGPAIQAARESWNQALAAARAARIQEGNFPDNLGQRIKSAHDEGPHV